MAGLCEGGNEPRGSLKAINLQTTVVTKDDTLDHLHSPNVVHAEVRQILHRDRTRARANLSRKPPSSVTLNEVAEVKNVGILMSMPQKNALSNKINLDHLYRHLFKIL
ncbi:hypothetical protein ANN_13008 [Periplaneta americana]|uniref:Uncharacterized protein n=1 Tax=Periplaneta americana TaxID=6978 RepID=A0ABQ8TKC9_PERAM|nr:hypothetical protein ANN_13008 [Periplaneta americana]